MFRVVVLALLVGCAAGVHSWTVLSDTSTASATGGLAEKPIAKVINMLQHMQTQLQKEQEQDEQLYDQFACWCETNDKVKTKAIADAEQKIGDLSSSIEEGGAKSQQLSTDIGSLGASLERNKAALAEATAVRDKDAADFHTGEKDAIVAIKGLEGALTTLGKHNDDGSAAMLEVQRQLQGSLQDADLRRIGLVPSQRRFVTAMLQTKQRQPSYSAMLQQRQTGEIFGVLSTMKDSFTANMESSRREETQEKASYTQLKAAKQKEIAAAGKQKDSKEENLAKTDEDFANNKVDLKDTTDQLAADRTFLADLKRRCGKMDQEWALRQKTRQSEVQAVSGAITILTDDDARDTLSKTARFFQRGMTIRNFHREEAATLLKKVSLRLKRPKLAMLATAMGNEVFGKIIESVDNMVAQLKQEAKDESSHRDWCLEEFHKNSLANDDKYHVKANVQTKIDDLDSAASRLTDALKAAKAEIAETQIEMKKAGENRAQESKGFQVTIGDQRAAQAVLGKAVEKLEAFYGRTSVPAGSLVQSATKHSQAPPATFTPYKKAGGGGGVVATIKEIIHESEQVQAQAISDENQSQLAYEEFVRDANKSIKSLRKEVNDMADQKAQADEELAQAHVDIKQNMKDLDSLHSVNNELHTSCDFVMKNFDERSDSRTEEIDALGQAKAMMSQA